MLHNTAGVGSVYPLPTIPVTQDPSNDLVVFLVNGNGINTGTTFSESSQALTASATNATTSTSNSQFGGSSISFNGSAFITYPTTATLYMGSAEFTAECWVRLVNNTAQQMFLFTGHPTTNAGTAFQFGIEYVNNTGFRGFVYTGGTNTVAASASTSYATGNWYHLALVRSGNNLRIFVNGTGGTSIALNGTSPYALNWSGNDVVSIGRLNSTDTRFPANDTNMQDVRITRGIARYTANFTAPTSQFTMNAFDPHQRYVTLALPAGGVNNATGIVDAVTRTTTTGSGSAVLSTTQTRGIGASMFIPAQGSTGTSRFNFGTRSAWDVAARNFTIEFWFFNVGTPSGTAGRILSINDGGSSAGLAFFQLPGTNGVSIGVGTTGSVTYNAVTALIGTFSASTWNHIAVSRVGTNLLLFLNGELRSTVAITGGAVTFNTNGALVIGSDSTTTAAITNCYIQNVRITNGIARYTETFARPLRLVYRPDKDTYYDRVVALINGNSIIDARGATITNTNVTQSSSVVRFGSQSMAFNGTSAYLQLPNNSNYNLSSNDWTIEGWVYLNTVASTQLVAYGGVVGTDPPNADLSFYIDYVTGSGFRAATYVSTTAFIAASTVVSDASAWHHIAAVRVGNTLNLFVNGIRFATVAVTGTTNFSTSHTLNIGRFGTTNTRYLNGNMQDFRITNGLARYTQNFPVPTGPFSAS